MQSEDIFACTVIGVILSLIGGFFFWLFCLNHLDVQEIGISYNSLNGQIIVQEQPGWYVTHPFVRVAVIDTRPFQVCLNGNARIMNCKLIRFKPEGAADFVSLQGFHYYEGTNGGSCSMGPGSNSTCGGMRSIMMGYAYSGKEWPFLEILEEIDARPVQRVTN